MSLVGRIKCGKTTTATTRTTGTTIQKLLSNCYVIHNNAFRFVSIFIVLLFLFELFGSEITLSISISSKFLSSRFHTNGIFTVLQYNRVCMFMITKLVSRLAN